MRLSVWKTTLFHNVNTYTTNIYELNSISFSTYVIIYSTEKEIAMHLVFISIYVEKNCKTKVCKLQINIFGEFGVNVISTHSETTLCKISQN